MNAGPDHEQCDTAEWRKSVGFEGDWVDEPPMASRSFVDLELSGDDRDRTGNLLVANQALSQLSYVPESFDTADQARRKRIAEGPGKPRLNSP